MTRDESGLRPLETVILRMREEGKSTPEIASRVGKRPGTVDRIIDLIDLLEGTVRRSRPTDQVLRPLERVVLRLRDAGLSYGEVGNRVARSGRQVRRIESYAHMKLALDRQVSTGVAR